MSEPLFNKVADLSVSNEKCQNQCDVFINLVVSLQRRYSWMLNKWGVQDCNFKRQERGADSNKNRGGLHFFFVTGNVRFFALN